MYVRLLAHDSTEVKDSSELPLIIRETQPFMRYILKRRGVFTSTVERAPARVEALDADDKRDISILLEAIAGDVESYPFGPE